MAFASTTHSAAAEGEAQRGSIAGVCAGIANYFGWDVTMVRLAFVLTTIFLTGAPLIAYLILWAIAD